MVVTTRISFAMEPVLKLERYDPPPFTGPPSSSVYIRCTVTRKSYSCRRLGCGGLAFPARRDEGPSTGDQTFYVYDPTLFLRYEETWRAVQDMLGYMPLLAAVDLSPENWQPHFAPATLASRMLKHAQKDDDHEDGGGRYQFSVHLTLEVRLEFSEPKAVVRACADAYMEPGAENQCSICMETLENVISGAMSPVNLPCFHCFHTRCITMWLFKGRTGTCPVCRHDLRHMIVSKPPWVSQTPKFSF